MILAKFLALHSRWGKTFSNKKFDKLQCSFNNNNNIGCDHKPPILDANVVISDIITTNSRELLYAHVYNRLIENKYYKTAKQLLMEVKFFIPVIDSDF